MMTEAEIHKTNRMICRDFVNKMQVYADMPLSLLEAYMEKRNPDFTSPLIENQIKLHQQLTKIKAELAKIEKEFSL